MDNLKRADSILKEIADAGIDVNKITTDLIEDGVQKFADSYHDLMKAIESKMKIMAE
jgi:transaldolase